MVKICLLKWNLNKIDGGVKVAVDLANELSNFHEVSLINIASSQIDKRDVPFSIHNSVQYKVLIPQNKRVRQILLFAARELRNFLKKNEIQVVISIGTMPNLFWIIATLGLSVKVVFSDHMSIDYNQDGKLYAFSRYLGAKCADKIITLTKSNGDNYIRKFKLPTDKVDYIYNWYSEIDTNYGYDLNNKKLITVARFSKQKGFDLLAEVAGKVLTQFPDWTLEIYGDGSQDIKSDFLERINDKGIQNQVKIMGNVKGVEKIYPGHSIYIMTSYYEGLPLVLLEAQQFNLPIVSFDCPTGPSEIIEESKNGYLVKCYDSKSMSEKVSKLILDAELRKSFSENSKINNDKFSKQTIISKWNSLIEELVEDK